VFSNYLLAQTQDNWTSFTIDDGLADRVVRTICESSDGALWFGTQNGVSHYQDGNWKTFTTDNGLADNNVRVIVESSDRALWFGTNGGGVSRYQNGVWETFTTADSLASNNIYAIYESRDKALWFACFDGGVSQFINGVWAKNYTKINGLVSNKVLTICESSDGALWVGTKEGVSRFFNDAWETFTQADGLAAQKINFIFESSDSLLWFGTTDGVNYYQDEIFTEVDSLNVQVIYESSDGALWFGTQQNGVSRYQNQNWTTFVTTAHELVDNNIKAICESGDGALWFGTSQGVSRYLAEVWRTFNTTDGLPSNSIQTIIASSDGNIWIGTLNGSAKYQDETGALFSVVFPIFNDIKAIYESGDSVLWFGTFGGGVKRYKDNLWKTFTTDSGLVSDFVYTIWESGDSALWLGTMEGVSRYKDNSWKTFTTDSGLVDNWINTICESSDGALWFGTSEGVSRYKDGIWKTFTTDNGLVDNYVNTISQSTDGYLWFGTNNGVSRYRYGIWKTFTTVDGLADDHVKAIFESSNGILWFGTGFGGVCFYQNETWTTITPIDGLGGYDVTAICESNDGALWFGTSDKGVSRLKPDKNPPFISLTKVPAKTTGNPSPLFGFRGWDYQTEQSKIMYSHATAPTFVFIGEHGYSSFSDDTFIELPPQPNGAYTFYVRARDRMGNISKPATYTFTIDITQPVTIINSPVNNDTLSKCINILGSAYDDSPVNDFDYYGICYGSGTEVNEDTEWDTLIHQIHDEKRSDTLTTWNTKGLQGFYQLKLFAKDTLGHQSEDIITVHIVDLIGEIINPEGGSIGGAADNIEIYFPPNSFSDNIEIKINMIPDLEVSDNDLYRFTSLAFDIMPKHIKSQKPGTLTITYADSDLVNVIAENRLGVFRYNESTKGWLLRGGAVDVERNRISTSITQLGRYGLFENLAEGDRVSISQVNCQPRIFSPKGGGHNTKTAISFDLGKEADVTIKIYNTAGRLVKVLKENEIMSHGNKVVFWDGKDKWGKFCVSGLYIVTIQAKEKMATKTVVVVNK